MQLLCSMKENFKKCIQSLIITSFQIVIPVKHTTFKPMQNLQMQVEYHRFDRCSFQAQDEVQREGIEPNTKHLQKANNDSMYWIWLDKGNNKIRKYEQTELLSYFNPRLQTKVASFPCFTTPKSTTFCEWFCDFLWCDIYSIFTFWNSNSHFTSHN